MTAKQIILESPVLETVLYDESILLLDKQGHIKIFSTDKEEVDEDVYRIKIINDKINPTMYVYEKKLIVLTETLLSITNSPHQDNFFSYKTQGKLDPSLSCITDRFIFFIETFKNKTAIISLDLISNEISKTYVDSCRLIQCLDNGIALININHPLKLSITRKNVVNSIDLEDQTQFLDFFEKPGKNKIDRLLFNKERGELLSGMLAWYLLLVDINSSKIKWVLKLTERVLGVSFFHQRYLYHCTMNSIYQIDPEIGIIISKQDLPLTKWIKKSGTLKLIDKTDKFFLLQNTGSGECFKIELETLQVDDVVSTNSEFSINSRVIKTNSGYFMVDYNFRFFKVTI
ncbi:MAG: hypothetical protein E6H07_03025 [Bacteroidetes bacterium]|nr:MAG: hypothetical protein E6H07_03025 [Bacteroidota bacterium]